jgi:hypothetical protein
MLPTVHGENEFSDADVVGFIMYDPPALQLLELKGQQLPDRVHPLVHCDQSAYPPSPGLLSLKPRRANRALTSWIAPNLADQLLPVNAQKHSPMPNLMADQAPFSGRGR